MLKLTRVALLPLLTFAGITIAAEPSSGTLTIDSGPIEFSQGPNVGVNPTPAGGAPMCLDPVPVCDHFDLTIDLPENIGEVFPSAIVRMQFTWDDITGAGVEDYDIYLYDADGNLVGDAATAGQPESISMLAEGGVADFTFDIIYFAVLGSTYTGVVELELGEPAPGADVDQFFEDNSVLARVLTPDAEPRTDYVERRSAAGGLGLLGLLVAAAGLRRRRR